MGRRCLKILVAEEGTGQWEGGRNKDEVKEMHGQCISDDRASSSRR